MRVHAITHVAFEGPAAIETWATRRGHELTQSAALTESYPEARDVDLLVVMGGPMDADDEVASPWLVAEKRFVREVLDAGSCVLGVCLGAQILAEVVGGRVTRNTQREIGWFEVGLTEAGLAEPLLAGWPTTFVAGHWHGDTFELLPETPSLASTVVTPNQLFVAEGGRAVGIQFHLEWDESTVAGLVSACDDELEAGGDFVQSADELLGGVRSHGEASRTLLYRMLDAVAEKVREGFSGR